VLKEGGKWGFLLPGGRELGMTRSRIRQKIQKSLTETYKNRSNLTEKTVEGENQKTRRAQSTTKKGLISRKRTGEKIGCRRERRVIRVSGVKVDR